MRKQRGLRKCLILLLLASLFILPSETFAHHPGVIGPLTHLGIRQVLVVLGASLVDAFNPTAISVLFLIIHQSLNRKNLVVRGLQYIAGILIVYIFAGLLLRESYMHGGPTLLLQSIQLLLAFLLFYTGGSEVVQSFSGTKLPGADQLIGKLQWLIDKKIVFPLGIVVGVIELLSTGAVYFSFVQVLSFDPNATFGVHGTLTIIYLVGFLVPLLLTVFFFQTINPLFSRASKGTMRIAKGGMGFILMLVAGWIGASAVQGLILIL